MIIKSYTSEINCPSILFHLHSETDSIFLPYPLNWHIRKANLGDTVKFNEGFEIVKKF